MEECTHKVCEVSAKSKSLPRNKDYLLFFSETHDKHEIQKKSLVLDMVITLPKANIAPENRQSQKQTFIPTIHSQVLTWCQFQEGALPP